MFEEVVKMLAEQLDVDASTITEQSEIVKDLGADSLDVIMLLSALEENTGKSIPEDKIADIKTVGDLVNILKTL